MFKACACLDLLISYHRCSRDYTVKPKNSPSTSVSFNTTWVTPRYIPNFWCMWNCIWSSKLKLHLKTTENTICNCGDPWSFSFEMSVTIVPLFLMLLHEIRRGRGSMLLFLSCLDLQTFNSMPHALGTISVHFRHQFSGTEDQENVMSSNLNSWILWTLRAAI